MSLVADVAASSLEVMPRLNDLHAFAGRTLYGAEDKGELDVTRASGCAERAARGLLEYASRNLPECSFVLATFDAAKETMFKCFANATADKRAVAFFEVVGCKRSFFSSVAAKMTGDSTVITGGFHKVAETLNYPVVGFETRDHAILFRQSIAESVSAMLAVWKPLDYGQFRDPDLGFLLEVAQTAFSSLRIRANIVQAGITGMARSLNRLDLGFIVADQNLEILHTNTLSEQMLVQRDFFYNDGKHLKFADGVAEVRLHQLLRHLASKKMGDDDGEGVIAIRKTDNEQLLRCAVTILRDCDDAILGRPLFGLTVPAVRSAKGADSAQLRRVGLSPAEAGLAADLLRGLTVSQHATARGITVTTARAHLKRAMRRFGVHRQADLIRHLMNLN
jgi:DNA-binding CsgD family transcriptional regulator